MGRNETAQSRQLMAERTEVIEIRMINWCLWKALVPAVLIFGQWPLYGLIPMDHPFERAFAHGELILFASILLFEIGVDTEGGARRPRALVVATAVVRAVAFVLMPAYWVIKHDAIMKEERLAKLSEQALEHAAILEKLRGYAALSCTIAAASLLISGILAVAAFDYHKAEELRAFGFGL
jgi:hypothetical protein